MVTREKIDRKRVGGRLLKQKVRIKASETRQKISYLTQKQQSQNISPHLQPADNSTERHSSLFYKAPQVPVNMFVLFFFLYFSPDLCNSQMVYSRVMPYDPRYIIHRSPPVRRSAMEALERLRLPVTRYFPQVDTQAASAPYQAPIAPLTGYQLTPEDIYALPPQWTDDFVQQLPERNEDEADYGNYDYEGSFSPMYRPAYPSEVYAQESMEPDAGDGNLYNDLMVNYLMGYSDPKEVMDQSEIFDMRRRSEGNNAQQSNPGVINISNVQVANKNASNSASNNSTLAPPVPFPSQPSPQVQVTAVPSAPEKKEMKSLVIPEPTLGERSDLSEEWKEEGQKEEPLFRPLQNSQRTTWSELEGPLARAKNTPKKSPIPLLKQMIQNAQKKKSFDPLTEELNNLKKQHGV